MTIQWMEPFALYGDSETAMVAGTPWAKVGGAPTNCLPLDPTGSGNRVFYPGIAFTEHDNDDRLVVPTARALIGVARRVYLTALPASSAETPVIGAWCSGGNVHTYWLEVSTTGKLQLWRVTATSSATTTKTLVAESTTQMIFAGAWYHVEAYVDVVTGDYGARVEGVEAFTGTHGSPPGSTTGIISFATRSDGLSSSTSYQWYMKDLIIWDNQGSVNNTFIGPVALYVLSPNADVSNGWSLSTGVSVYPLIDEETPNDADYISAPDTLPAPAIVELENLPADIVSVRAVQPTIRMWKSDGGDATVQMTLDSGGSDDAGADRPLQVTAAYFYDISELDPATAALWTPVAVDAVKLEIDRTT